MGHQALNIDISSSSRLVIRRMKKSFNGKAEERPLGTEANRASGIRFGADLPTAKIMTRI